MNFKPNMALNLSRKDVINSKILHCNIQESNTNVYIMLRERMNRWESDVLGKEENSKMNGRSDLEDDQMTELELDTPDALLSQVNLKALINRDTFYMLPTDVQRSLAQLLPSYDRDKTLNASGLDHHKQERPEDDDAVWLNPSALANEFFAKALLDYSSRHFPPTTNGSNGSGGDLLSPSRLRNRVDNRRRLSTPSSFISGKTILNGKSSQSPASSVKSRQQQTKSPTTNSSDQSQQQDSPSPSNAAVKRRGRKRKLPDTSLAPDNDIIVMTKSAATKTEPISPRRNQPGTTVTTNDSLSPLKVSRQNSLSSSEEATTESARDPPQQSSRVASSSSLASPVTVLPKDNLSLFGSPGVGGNRRRSTKSAAQSPATSNTTPPSMPPPKQTKTLASMREKLRLKRQLKEAERHTNAAGSMTPHPSSSSDASSYFLQSSSHVKRASSSNSSSPSYYWHATNQTSHSSPSSSSCLTPGLNPGKSYSPASPQSLPTQVNQRSSDLLSPFLLSSSDDFLLNASSDELQSCSRSLFDDDLTCPSSGDLTSSSNLFSTTLSCNQPGPVYSHNPPIQPANLSNPSTSPASVHHMVGGQTKSSMPPLSSLLQQPICASTTTTATTNTIQSSNIVSVASTTITSTPAATTSQGAKLKEITSMIPLSMLSKLLPSSSTSSTASTSSTSTASASSNLPTRAFFVDGDNLSSTLAMFQKLKPGVTITQQQVFLIPDANKSQLLLCRAPPPATSNTTVVSTTSKPSSSSLIQPAPLVTSSSAPSSTSDNLLSVPPKSGTVKPISTASSPSSYQLIQSKPVGKQPQTNPQQLLSAVSSQQQPLSGAVGGKSISSKSSSISNQVAMPARLISPPALPSDTRVKKFPLPRLAASPTPPSAVRLPIYVSDTSPVVDQLPAADVVKPYQAANNLTSSNRILLAPVISSTPSSNLLPAPATAPPPTAVKHPIAATNASDVVYPPHAFYHPHPRAVVNSAATNANSNCSRSPTTMALLRPSPTTSNFATGSVYPTVACATAGSLTLSLPPKMPPHQQSPTTAYLTSSPVSSSTVIIPQTFTVSMTQPGGNLFATATLPTPYHHPHAVPANNNGINAFVSLPTASTAAANFTLINPSSFVSSSHLHPSSIGNRFTLNNGPVVTTNLSTTNNASIDQLNIHQHH